MDIIRLGDTTEIGRAHIIRSEEHTKEDRKSTPSEIGRAHSGDRKSTQI